MLRPQSTLSVKQILKEVLKKKEKKKKTGEKKENMIMPLQKIQSLNKKPEINFLF